MTPWTSPLTSTSRRTTSSTASTPPRTALRRAPWTSYGYDTFFDLFSGSGGLSNGFNALCASRRDWPTFVVPARSPKGRRNSSVFQSATKMARRTGGGYQTDSSRCTMSGNCATIRMRSTACASDLRVSKTRIKNRGGPRRDGTNLDTKGFMQAFDDATITPQRCTGGSVPGAHASLPRMRSVTGARITVKLKSRG